MSCPDNYSQWEEHEQKQEAWLKTRPVCGYCGEPIQDDFCYEINGEYFCEMCLYNHFMVDVDSIAL